MENMFKLWGLLSVFAFCLGPTPGGIQGSPLTALRGHSWAGGGGGGGGSGTIFGAGD